VTQLHGPLGTVTATDENGGLGRSGKLETGPSESEAGFPLGLPKPVREHGRDATTGTRNCCRRFAADEHEQECLFIVPGVLRPAIDQEHS
jgi:hypothetical protein